MKVNKDTIDYQVNLVELREMEKSVPMTLTERHAIRKWVHRGNDIESNPWDYRDGDESQLNFLQAFRLEYGYSSGPWDYWKGPDAQPLWNESQKCFLSPNDYC